MRIALAALLVLAGGCSGLLPRGESIVQGPWQSFEDAQAAFDRIVPYQTDVEELKRLNIDPARTPNITLLNYSDVLRRFLPTPTSSLDDLDRGVRECIEARTACTGLLVNQRVVKRRRYGSFLADFLNFERKVDITGWQFTGLLLIRDGRVIYKLTGGQPQIREYEENRNPLGPFQGSGEAAARSAVQ